MNWTYFSVTGVTTSSRKTLLTKKLTGYKHDKIIFSKSLSKYHKSYDMCDLNFINILPAALRFKTLNERTLEIYSIRGKYVSLTPLRFNVLESMMSRPFTKRHNTFTSRDRVEWKSVYSRTHEERSPIERISGEILREIIADRNSLSATHGSQPTVVNEAKISGAGDREKRGRTGPKD